MRWSPVPFGKYRSKTLPEIILQDPDWFFWMLSKLYGKIGEEAQELARRARSIQIPKRGRERREVEYEFDTEIIGLPALSLSTPTALLPDRPSGCHTSISGGFFAGNMTSEQAVSWFEISGDAILAGTNE
jgi:hypothetical protein